MDLKDVGCDNENRIQPVQNWGEYCIPVSTVMKFQIPYNTGRISRMAKQQTTSQDGL